MTLLRSAPLPLSLLLSLLGLAVSRPVAARAPAWTLVKGSASPGGRYALAFGPPPARDARAAIQPTYLVDTVARRIVHTVRDWDCSWSEEKLVPDEGRLTSVALRLAWRSDGTAVAFARQTFQAGVHLDAVCVLSVSSRGAVTEATLKTGDVGGAIDALVKREGRASGVKRPTFVKVGETTLSFDATGDLALDVKAGSHDACVSFEGTLTYALRLAAGKLGIVQRSIAKTQLDLRARTEEGCAQMY